MGKTAQLVENFVQEGLIRGAVILFGTPSETLFSGAFGTADHLTGKPMTLNSVFDLASITKAVCISTLLALAVERRKISLDVPYTEYLPGYRGKSLYIATVRDLATHYSGLDATRPYDSEMFSGPAALLDAMLDLRIVRLPRTEYCYTCANYILLGLILEAVSGKRLDELARQEIFTPLGMNRSSWGIPKTEVLPDMVHMYLTTNHAKIPPEHFPPELRGYAERDDLPSDETAKASVPRCVGNAGLFADAGDLAKFARFMLRKPFQESVWQEAAGNLAPAGMHPRSAGWDMEPTGVFSASTIHHTGWSGQSLWIDPEAQLFGMVLTNRCGDHGKGKACRLELIRAVREEFGK